MHAGRLYGLYAFFKTPKIHIMQLLSCLFISLFFQYAYAQTFQVTYESLYDGTLYKNQLAINDSVSIWELISDPQATDKADELLVKNYSGSSLILIDYIFQKKFYVKDSLHPMSWEHQADQKKILGYNCHSATTFFRGRNYMAYYTSDLAVKGGPWKFGGLPGLILEVVSSDAHYSFRAITIQQGEPVYISDFDLHENEQLSWQEYCHKTIYTINQYVRYMQSISNDPGSQINLRVDRPEIIYPSAQTGTGIASD
jgi:GLPGLI family protein